MNNASKRPKFSGSIPGQVSEIAVTREQLVDELFGLAQAVGYATLDSMAYAVFHGRYEGTLLDGKVRRLYALLGWEYET